MLDGYYIWLIRQIDTDSHLASRYKKLLLELYDTEFYWSIPLDSNRSLDGLGLRDRYEKEVNDPECDAIFEHLDGSCSVLEMMIALAIRMEIDIMHDDNFGNRSCDWFWNMVDSLGLSDQIDANFDLKFVQNSMDIFLSRRFERDGRGGLFSLNHCRKDLRRTEIWYQMQFWLDENFPEVF